MSQEIREQQMMKSQVGVVKVQIDELAQQVHSIWWFCVCKYSCLTLLLHLTLIEPTMRAYHAIRQRDDHFEL